MSRFSLRVLPLSFLLLLLGVASAFATTALYVTDSEQATLSTAVVVAKVGVSEVLPHDRYETVMTRTRVEVQEVMYGEAPEDLVIHQIGGTLGGQTVYIPGDARFEQGERCVLFLRNVEGRWYLTAMEQSKYRLVEHARFGLLMERKLGDGLVVRNEGGKLVDYEAPIRPPIKRLSSFRAALSRLAAEKKEAR